MICVVTVIGYLTLAYLLVQLIRLVFADADLSLLWYEKFGKKPGSLSGQVVWITGASSGIGECLAYDLAKAGCRLVLSARRKDELDRVKKQCLTSGRISEDDIMTLPLDLLAYTHHASAVEKVLAKFNQIDVLVNNGGRSQRAMARDTELEVDRQIMDINYLGTVSMTKALLPQFIKQKQGHIVVTSSVAGKVGAPCSASYSGSKFAVHGWFDTLRLEESMNNITVTLVCPGPVHTNLTHNSFTSTSGEVWGKASESKKMSTERCSELITVAIANKVDEAWISRQPILLVTYISQYLPSLAIFVGKKMGMKMILKLRSRDEES